MRIQCFGAARDIVGAGSFHLEGAEGLTVAALKDRVISEYPAFGELVSFAIARNEEYATDEERIDAGDEVVIIPPVAGG